MKIKQNVDCSDCKSCVHPYKQGFHYHRYVKDRELYINTDNDHHMIFVLSGSLSVTYEEIDNYICEQNHILLFIEKFHYQIKFLEDTEIILLKYTAAIQVCDKLGIDDGNPYLDTLVYKFHALDMRQPMINSIQAIADYLKDGVRCMYLHKAKQSELFILFMHYYTMEETLYFFFRSIRNHTNFCSIVIEKHIYAKNVEELAELCGYGLSNFKKLFRKNFNESPYKWMMQQMAKRLRARLLDNTTPLKAIAFEFHFSDQSHLGAFCKQHLGATPTEIRSGRKESNLETVM